MKSAFDFGYGQIFYHDVNKRAIQLSEHLMAQGYNVPMVADTDLHARDKNDLMVMGTSRVITDINTITPADVVASMKNNIFQGNYTNRRRYVSAFHLLGSFCFPVIMPGRYESPRAEGS